MALLHHGLVAAGIVACFALWIAMDDYGQCERSCRVHHGTSGWLDSAVTGVRSGMIMGDECTCSEAESGKVLGNVPRLFAAEPAGFPYIETGKAGVCGEDRNHYLTAEAASDAGVKIVNCGPCGACSNLQDVGTYHNMSQSLTKEATKCGIVFLFAGRSLARLCMRSLTTLSAGCTECWLANMGCTTSHCFKECVLKWELPTNSKNNPAGKDGSESHASLTSCLLCDEQHCSPTFIRSCGANRRCAGSATDIGRPPSSICPSVNIVHMA